VSRPRSPVERVALLRRKGRDGPPVEEDRRVSTFPGAKAVALPGQLTLDEALANLGREDEEPRTVDPP
jgi:hypothetical protein